ncbi:putative lipoprotein [Mycobacteroides abscessus MAB_082312_2258]|uniref:Putative lipoprotein n=1 Tax=Mycobacteroides abscessus MAB_091912_2446 TaxID=1335414 RepID=A0A829M3E5_9MYCO|nr:putative lipoprotein [Mycobacteroides abscessus MAB_082312_2258]ESV62739.1 putative lipoprotein [Mycobacteroides abscessus MAB_091912_2446]
MRVWSVLALIVLVAGCGAHRQQAPPTSTSTDTTTSQAAPGPQASVESVIRWIEAGDPVDAENFRTVDQDGTPGRLAEGDVAFRAPRELGPESSVAASRR